MKLKNGKMILVPYPAQGHVTPMLDLASALHARGFHTILLTPHSIHRSVVSKQHDDISFVSVPDGVDTRDFFTIDAAMETTMPAHLERLIRDQAADGSVVCVVVDVLASWAFQVADKCGVPAAGFWPAMLATYHLIAAIPDLIRTGLISHDTGCPQDIDTVSSSLLPSQPILSTEDLPWLIGSPAARTGRFKFWNRALNRSRTAKWLLVNSFPNEKCSGGVDYEKEQERAGAEDTHPLVLGVGPLKLQQHGTSTVDKINSSFWEEDASCLEWLDMHKMGTVVYISFGSWVSPIGETKIESLALALEASGRPFLWVLAPAWRRGLPNGFVERMLKKQLGKVVAWAPQVEVLRHSAVGCYLTHCGWNSTMEAIQCKKRLLCYPVAGDQFVNCNYIVKVWKIGVRIYSFGEKDVEQGLRKVMDDDDGGGVCEMMNKSLLRLHEMTMGVEARSTVMDNLNLFVQDLLRGDLKSHGMGESL